MSSWHGGIPQRVTDDEGVSHQFVPLQTCGLVAESHVIDESSEWRNFGDKVSCYRSANSSSATAMAC